MTALFDNIFVRVHEFYKKKDDIPITYGIFFLLITKVCILFTVASALNIVTNGMFSSGNIDRTAFYSIYGAIVGFLVIMDIRRYANSETRKAILYKYQRRVSIPMWLIFMIPVCFLLSGFALIFFLTTGK